MQLSWHDKFLYILMNELPLQSNIAIKICITCLKYILLLAFIIKCTCNNIVICKVYVPLFLSTANYICNVCITFTHPSQHSHIHALSCTIK